VLALAKLVHVTSVGLSIAGFTLRGAWMLRGSPRLRERWVRVVPHVVDTVLLASALVLVYGMHQYPFVHGWLTAKVIGLVVYIGLGMVALRFGKTRGVRLTAFVLALATFAWIVAVAVTHNPVPWA